MNKTIIDKIALCQWLIDYWRKECGNMSIDYLDLDNDLDKINVILNEILHSMNETNGRS